MLNASKQQGNGDTRAEPRASLSVLLVRRFLLASCSPNVIVNKTRPIKDCVKAATAASTPTHYLERYQAEKIEAVVAVERGDDGIGGRRLRRRIHMGSGAVALYRLLRSLRLV